MKIPTIRVIVDSGDRIQVKDDLKAKTPRMSLTKRLQILLKSQNPNGKR